MKYNFLIQKLDENPLNVEALELINEIKAWRERRRYYMEIECVEISIDDLVNFQKKGYVPIGSLDFVRKYLSLAYNISSLQPIEVPKILRQPEFLLREYRIVDYCDIPKTGTYFIKDVTELKSLAFLGDMNTLFNGEYTEQLRNSLNSKCKYQVSSVLDILAEYRVIVDDNKIEGIQFYDGKPTIMPTEQEINKIVKMIQLYSLSECKPRAYTMDVAIVKQNEKERDLALIEMHPFVSCGTYGYTSMKLPAMYQKGFDWYLQTKEKALRRLSSSYKQPH